MPNTENNKKTGNTDDDKISLYTFFNYKFDILHEDNQKLQKQIQTILLNQQESQQTLTNHKTRIEHLEKCCADLEKSPEQLTNHEDRITALESSYDGAWGWIKTIGAGVIVALILDVVRWIH